MTKKVVVSISKFSFSNILIREWEDGELLIKQIPVFVKKVCIPLECTVVNQVKKHGINNNFQICAKCLPEYLLSRTKV